MSAHDVLCCPLCQHTTAAHVLMPTGKHSFTGCPNCGRASLTSAWHSAAAAPAGDHPASCGDTKRSTDATLSPPPVSPALSAASAAVSACAAPRAAAHGVSDRTQFATHSSPWPAHELDRFVAAAHDTAEAMRHELDAVHAYTNAKTQAAAHAANVAAVAAVAAHNARLIGAELRLRNSQWARNVRNLSAENMESRRGIDFDEVKPRYEREQQHLIQIFARWGIPPGSTELPGAMPPPPVAAPVPFDTTAQGEWLLVERDRWERERRTRFDALCDAFPVPELLALRDNRQALALTAAELVSVCDRIRCGVEQANAIAGVTTAIPAAALAAANLPAIEHGAALAGVEDIACCPAPTTVTAAADAAVGGGGGAPAGPKVGVLYVWCTDRIDADDVSATEDGFELPAALRRFHRSQRRSRHNVHGVKALRDPTFDALSASLEAMFSDKQYTAYIVAAMCHGVKRSGAWGLPGGKAFDIDALVACRPFGCRKPLYVVSDSCYSHVWVQRATDCNDLVEGCLAVQASTHPNTHLSRGFMSHYTQVYCSSDESAATATAAPAAAHDVQARAQERERATAKFLAFTRLSGLFGVSVCGAACDPSVIPLIDVDVAFPNNK